MSFKDCFLFLIFQWKLHVFLRISAYLETKMKEMENREHNHFRLEIGRNG